MAAAKLMKEKTMKALFTDKTEIDNEGKKSKLGFVRPDPDKMNLNVNKLPDVLNS